MNEELFPEVQWSDEEPTEVTISVKRRTNEAKQ